MSTKLLPLVIVPRILSPSNSVRIRVRVLLDPVKNPIPNCVLIKAIIFERV